MHETSASFPSAEKLRCSITTEEQQVSGGGREKRWNLVNIDGNFYILILFMFHIFWWGSYVIVGIVSTPKCIWLWWRFIEMWTRLFFSLRAPFSCSWKFNVSSNELLIFHHLHSCFPPLKTTSTALCMEHGKSESNNSSTQKKHQNSQVCCSFFFALVVFTRKFRHRRALFRRPAFVRRSSKMFFSLFIYFSEKNVPSQHLPDIKVNVNRESNVKL